jgi:hypothetical protein
LLSRSPMKIRMIGRYQLSQSRVPLAEACPWSRLVSTRPRFMEMQSHDSPVKRRVVGTCGAGYGPQAEARMAV